MEDTQTRSRSPSPSPSPHRSPVQYPIMERSPSPKFRLAIPEIKLGKAKDYVESIMALVLAIFAIHFIVSTVHFVVKERNRQISEALTKTEICRREFKDNKCDANDSRPIAREACLRITKCMQQVPNVNTNQIVFDYLGGLADRFLSSISAKALCILLTVGLIFMIFFKKKA